MDFDPIFGEGQKQKGGGQIFSFVMILKAIIIKTKTCSCCVSQSYTIRSKSSRHIQTKILGQKCKRLKKLEFTYSKSIAPTFYIKFFKNFPQLVVIDVFETILDNESFDSIGQTCLFLKELNASGSTITDTGLEYLSVSSTEKGELR